MAGSRIEVQATATHLGPFPHAYPTEMTIVEQPSRRCGIEAYAVVADGEVHAVLLGGQLDPDVLGSGVLGNVCQRLLGDPIDDRLHLGSRPVIDLGVDHDVHVGLLGEGVSVQLEGTREAVLVQGRWS